MLVVCIGWYAYAENRQQYWDDKVRELCAKEGEGVALQRVELAPGDAAPPTPDERYADAGAAYVSRWREEVIRSAKPRVLRTEVILIRARDQTIQCGGQGRRGGRAPALVRALTIAEDAL